MRLDMGTSLLMAEAKDDSETSRLVAEAAAGDEAAWTKLVTLHRDRLKHMLALRMDRRLQGRVDPSDVVQESCLAAAKHIANYAANPTVPFFIWLRWIAGRKLIDQQRRHL